MSLDAGLCRSCKAPVRWARSAKTGKRMPLEQDDERGNIVVAGDGRAHAFKDHAAAVAKLEEWDMIGSTWISHHATCPQRGQWSRAPQRQKADPTPVQETLI